MSAISTVLVGSITASPNNNLPIESNKAKGCGYFGQNNGIHTVQFIVGGFVGSIIIQGSLEGKPTDDDWFDVESASLVAPSLLTANITKNFTGNFVWVRAVITDFDTGNINQVLLSVS